MSAPKVIGSDLSRLTLGHFNVFGSGSIRLHHQDFRSGSFIFSQLVVFGSDSYVRIIRPSEAA